MNEPIFSPHFNFFMEVRHRTNPYEMRTFHFHQRYEIYYLVSGTRRYFIGDNSFLVNTGDFVVISPDQMHRTSPVDQQAHTRYVINFNLESCLSFASEYETELLACFKNKSRPVIHVPMQHRGMIESILNRLMGDHSKQMENSECIDCMQLTLKQQVLFCELLIYINEFMSNQSEDEVPSHAHNKLIDEIQQYIFAHYADDMSLSAIASKFYISPSYLSRLFKRETNLSIVEYINSIRITTARGLLEKTDTKISDLAHQVGFSTTVHFTRVFKAKTGLSPYQYRKYYHDCNKCK